MSMSDNDFFGEYLFKPEEKNQELTKVDGLDQRQAALREMFQITYAGDIWEILGSLYDAGYRRAAPPAAAHGDEAVRKNAEYFRFIESCPIRTGVVLSRKAHEAGFDLRAECERVMAMRAQGDGD